MKNYRIYLLLLSLTLVIASCGDIKKSFSYLNTLQKSLGEKYPNEHINIKASNGTELTISFVNSEFNTSATDQQQKIACEIGALITADTSSEKPHFTAGTVEFVDKKSGGIVESSTSKLYDMYLNNAPGGCDSLR